MRLLATLLIFLPSLFAQVSNCVCDHALHNYSEKSCGLCAEVDKFPETQAVVFIRDNSPLKPNRWLAMPRKPTSGKMQLLADLTPAERAELFREAIAKAKEVWGDRWGLALNGANSRGQCHLHIHIGRLIEGVEWGKPLEISATEEVPDTGDNGLWIHPVANGKLHVHVEVSTETVLAR
jgi:diadenosine tetraphosphate (Ap4A) HIT family hydrolase